MYEGNILISIGLCFVDFFMLSFEYTRQIDNWLIFKRPDVTTNTNGSKDAPLIFGNKTELGGYSVYGDASW